MNSRLRHLLTKHKALLAVVLIAVALTFIPYIQTRLVTGSAWQNMPVTYGDEFIYYSHISEVATGNILFGNPYYLEHRFDPQLALFGSSILAALPLFLGLSLQVTLALNFIVWGALLVVLIYWLLRELGLQKWLSATVSLFAYIQSYDLIFRASVQQQVFPFFILFYIALIRFLKNPNKASIIYLSLTFGVSFYVYGYLWQLATISLGLIFLYALVLKEWFLLKRTAIASLAGGIIGFPPLFYTLWVTHQPFFWESMNRWGLVNTHSPSAEMVYSGGWVAAILLIAAVAWWRGYIKQEYALPIFFISLTGLALWIAQGSNIITGKHLELGEHLRRFIILWLPIASVVVAVTLWKQRNVFVYIVFALLAVGNLWFMATNLNRFYPSTSQRAQWADEQLYAKPLAWLDAHVAEPTVVWGDPHLQSTVYIPALTKHYVLHEEFGEFNLLSNDEFYERYLVSQYFNDLTVEDLKNNLPTYVGRAKAFHDVGTAARKTKLCKLLHFYNGGLGCATALTAQDLLGDDFFETLEKRFTKDIKPNIKTYLEKYHVAYIIKDTERNPQYHPQELDATLEYNDGRFEIYQLP